ncbi:hypothetical protein FHR59_002133 [Xanthomonas arboricola]|nr:hypothetical protein [Xanthomonas arboricola]
MIIPADQPSRPITLRGTVSRESLTPFASSLTTPFVGMDLRVVPATSAFGLLARLVRLNALDPIDLFRLFGIRSRRADDLSELMTFSEVRQAALARALHLPTVPQTWNLTAWFPFQGPSSILKTGWALRYCPQCMHSGYHTLLHQLPWIQRCPWHGVALQNTCMRCGRKPAALADWCFDENLACECGHSLLSTKATLKQSAGPPSGAADFLATYLEWATTERGRTILVIPELPTDSAAALAGLVQLPKALEWRCGKPQIALHKRSWRTAIHGPSCNQEALRQLDTLRQDRPGFLTVPAQIRPAMANVAADLALKLPESTLTDREMTLFLAGVAIEAPATFRPARRGFSGSLSALPPWEVAGQQFLNLACLHPTSYRSVVKLIDIALDGRSLFDFHGQAKMEELNLLIKVCGCLLTRGYAEGLRATLSQHIPDLFGMRRDCPHLTQPWMLAVVDRTRLIEVHATWHSLGSPHMAASLLEEADKTNKRRERAHARRRPRSNRQ